MLYHFSLQITRAFPKIDHSGSAVRIVLEQNKLSKKVTSDRDWTQEVTNDISVFDIL